MTSTQTSTTTTDLTDTQIQQWQYNFSLFDPESTGFIQTDEIGTLIRTMNYNVTEQQINQYINMYTNSQQCDFATLIHIVIHHIHEWTAPITVQQLYNAFASYDTYKTGKIHGSMLVDILRNTGETMTQDDVDGLLCEITIDGDNMIEVQQLIDYMVQSSDYPVQTNTAQQTQSIST